MIINNFKKSKIKILLDIEDIKNFEISLNEWLNTKKKNLDKILKNFNELKNLTPKELNIYSYKYILFYIFIKY